MPAQASTPQPNAMKTYDLRRWAINGFKPNDGIKACNKQTATVAPTKTSPAKQLTPEQLGTKGAYTHTLVVKHPKRSTARKVAKRFIELYGQRGFDARLDRFHTMYAISVEITVNEEFKTSRTEDVITGIRAAWYALEETYSPRMDEEENGDGRWPGAEEREAEEDETEAVIDDKPAEPEVVVVDDLAVARQRRAEKSLSPAAAMARVFTSTAS